MTEVLNFPGLGLSFNLNRVAFSLGGIDVYWYGIMIATGFMLALLYVFRRGKEFGVNVDKLIDVIFVSTFGAIIGARAYYCIFKWDYYGSHLKEVFNLRNGGIAIYGGIIGAILVGYFMCKLKKMKVLPTLDLVVAGFFIGQSIGRWGNFFNIEAFGGNTSLPWGMTSDSIVSYLAENEASLEAIGMDINPLMPVHPTFFYESLWCFLGFLFIAWYTKRRKFDGELTILYALIYGAERFVVEGLRTDSLMIGNFRVSQLLAGVCVIVCIGLLFYFGKKAKEGKLPPVYGTTEEARLALEEENKKSKEKKTKTEIKEETNSDTNTNTNTNTETNTVINTEADTETTEE